MPITPMGTEIRKMRRQLIGASNPPMTRPMNEPVMPAMLLIPSAMPRWCSGKASVRIAATFAESMAAPTPWKMRIVISQMAAAVPCIGVMVSSSEKKVKMAKPRLKSFTRPYMSPRRPKLTTSTAVTAKNPRIIQSR